MTDATLARVSSLARQHTKAALAVLFGIMADEEASPAVRVAAADKLLDRGWGKPSQPISGDPDNPINVVTRIELVGVKPIAAPPY